MKREGMREFYGNSMTVSKFKEISFLREPGLTSETNSNENKQNSTQLISTG